MSTVEVQLDAGGLVPAGTKADGDAAERVVARTYRHPALGERPVIRLTSDRLGEAEDLAMEFLGFEAPAVSAPIALQRRRSLGFAAWALINDPQNARYALDLVKRMKAAARQARSKPGHAWDSYTVMAQDLGRAAPHFLPPFWEDAGRAYKDLGNSTYAGRALTKSLEAERTHALPADRARRRDVVLEFALSGCLAGSALSEYGNDLQGQYAPAEAYAIFRDLCVRRTRGGMAPWATLPKDLTKLAKAAGLDADQELETWLEELIDAPGMGRAPYQFWKTCSARCKRIVARSPAFAVALLRLTTPEERYYGESKLGPWLDLLDEWGVLEYLSEDEHRGAPPLGEPIADWFGRIVCDESPAPVRTLQLLEKLAPRLRAEAAPLPLSVRRRYGGRPIDIDLLEACLVQGIKVADPPPAGAVTFAGWLSANVDHPFRNQDIVASVADERFQPAVFRALEQALACRGGTANRGYRQSGIEQRAFPLAAGDRPGIKALWHRHALDLVRRLEESGLASFEMAHTQQAATLWPDTLRLFPDVAERLRRIDPAAMLQRTLQAGVFDEYGLPALEQVIDTHKIAIKRNYQESNLHLVFPRTIVSNSLHAYVIGGDGTTKEQELRLPKKSTLGALVTIGDDLAVIYRDEKYQSHLFWASNPSQEHDIDFYRYYNQSAQIATVLADGSVFLGEQAVRPGDKQMPQAQPYLHDGTRFWRVTHEYDAVAQETRSKIAEIDPQTGKPVRESVPPWLEETEDGTIMPGAVELIPAPAGTEASPLGVKDRMLGWKTIKRRDGSLIGVGIDGRRWDRPLFHQDGSFATPVALLRQPGTDRLLPVTSGGARGGYYWLWDPNGTTVVAALQDFGHDFARGQVAVLPLLFWHFLKVRDEASSHTLRGVSHGDCAALFEAAAADRAQLTIPPRTAGQEPAESPLATLLPAVKRLLPTAPERLALGVARVVERAEQRSAAFTALRDKTFADSANATTSAAIVVNHRSDTGAAYWGLPECRVYGPQETGSLSEHLHAAAEFLKGHSEAGGLPRTNYLWFPMLEKLPLRCWQAYWRALTANLSRKDGGETPWLEFLKLWQALGIAELPGQFALMEGYPKGAKKNQWGGYDVVVQPGRSFRLQNRDDRFIVVEILTHRDERLPYQFLRYSTAAAPGAPPGYEVTNVRELMAKDDPAEIAAFLKAAESCTAPPLPSPAELEAVATNVAVSPAEVGLVWMGGVHLQSYEHNFLPTELRKGMGLKAADANVGRQALRNLSPLVLEQLNGAVVSAGCAAPFADDRRPVLRRLEAAWGAAMPRRLSLDAALQTRLSALGRATRWHDLGELLAAAGDPARHPVLQPRESRVAVVKQAHYSTLGLEARNKEEPVVAGGFLASVVQLVSVVHAETPAGHPARAAMPPLIEQATRLLEDPRTLLELRSFHLTGADPTPPLKPREWLDTHIGKTTADASVGIVSVDDGLIVGATVEGQHQVLLAFRPAKLKGEADLARLRGLLAPAATAGYEMHHAAMPAVVTLKSSGFQKLATAILASSVPPGQWPANPAHTAPEVVQAIGKKLKLGEDASALYAQLLALPEPTKANVCTWNGWTAGQYQKAAAELAAGKHVLEATRARAGRALFLPGEWVELKAPWLPIERWKLAHLAELGMGVQEPCPAGGPLVLRPFEELFAAAWQRVAAGDAPRYEDIKRKKKTK